VVYDFIGKDQDEAKEDSSPGWTGAGRCLLGGRRFCRAILPPATAAAACRKGIKFGPVTKVTGFFLLPIEANKEKLCCSIQAERTGCIIR
jgi:hypothetical protein